MKAVVLGGTGFLGINMVEALREAGHSVRVARRRAAAAVLLRRWNVEVCTAALDDIAALRKAMEGCDVVYLAAGYYPRYSIDLAGALDEAVRGVSNACEAALDVGVQRFVYTSSVGSLGAAPENRAADETDIPKELPTESVYRAVKWAMERAVDDAVARGLPAVTLLPGGCLGPWDVRVGTGGFLVGIAQGSMPWWVDGIVNLVDVRDVARAHVTAAESPVGERYCIAGHTVRVSWLLAHVAQRYGGVAPSECLSADEARARADREERIAAVTGARVALPREMVDLVTAGQAVSNARAEAALGLTLRPLDDALDSAHEWFARYGFIKRRTTHAPLET